MTGRQFINSLANGRVDVIALVVDILKSLGAPHCVIGGLAVNAYAEPVVSLDLDIVVASPRLDDFCQAAESAGFRLERFPNSINLNMSASDLRIQVQTDSRYQQFLKRAVPKNVLGYELHVADINDVALGKTWAYLDTSRRASKRQKDLADITRLVEVYPELRLGLPKEVRETIPE